MQLPALLPQKLQSYQSEESDSDLYAALLLKTNDLIPFFESACDDETWCEQHKPFIKLAIQHFTQQALAGDLAQDQTLRIAKAIQPHFDILRDCLPLNLTVFVGNQSFEVNSLLLDAQSPYMHTLLRESVSTEETPRLTLQNVSPQYFPLFIEFSQKGALEQLWRLTREEIFELMSQAKDASFQGVVDEAAEVLKRYITPHNVLNMIAQTTKEEFFHLRNLCLQFANQIAPDLGLQFFIQSSELVQVELLDQRTLTFDNYKEIASVVSHLTFSSIMARDAQFSEIIKMTPHLQGVNLTQTTVWSDRIFDLPRNLRQLNLTQCSWLDNDKLKRIILHCPKIDMLILRGCANVNYLGWGDLQQLKDLQFLDLSRCYQLTDDDLVVLSKAAKKLTALSLAECRKLSDQALISFVKNVVKIENLDLSYIPLSDAVLIEISYNLTNLKRLHLNRCERITPKGLNYFLPYALKLESLELILSPIPADFIEKIKISHPHLKVVT